MTALFLMLHLLAMGQQSVVTEYITTNDGLSDNSVTCALRDSYGLLWVGTENGLNCFDGLRLQVYRDMVASQNPFETNTVMSLFEYNGDLWFGGTAGLYVFHRFDNVFSRFNVRTEYDVVIASAVPKIVEQGHLIWIATLGQGIFIYDTEKETLTQDSRHGNFFSDITVGSDGLVYAVTLTGEIAVFRGDGQFFLTYDVEGYDFDKERISMVHSGGDLWLASGTRLLRLNPTARHTETQAEMPALGTIRSMVADSQGRLFLGSDNGVYAWTAEGKQLERIDGHNDASRLSDPIVNGLIWDADSSLLAFTPTGGLNSICFQQRGFTFIPLPGETGQHMVKALCRDGEGTLWIGTDHGLYRGDHDNRTVVKETRLPSYDITALMLDGDDLWIGTRSNGIRVLNLKTGLVTAHTFSNTLPYTLPSNEVNSIYRTSQGDIYVLTSWGLSRYVRSNGNFYGHAHISAMTSFICMQEAASGWLWAASSNKGLFCKRTPDGQFDGFRSAAIGRRAVNVFLCDQQGNLWAATNGGGLYRYSSKQGDFVRYDVEGTVLYDQVVTFMEEDEQGALWIGTRGAIIRISPSRDVQGMQMFPFPFASNSHRLQRSACTHGFGNVLFGGDGGVFCISTGELAPKVMSQRAYIRHLSLPYATNSKEELRRIGLDVLLYTREKIELPYADNSFTLHFASERYSGMEAPKYEYMLQGFDQTWVHASSTPDATYANLPPGNYEFLLRHVGMSDESEMARLRITVLPPWYLTTLAFIFYLFLAVASIAGIFYIGQRRIKRHYNRQMSDFLQQQEKESFQSKIRFFIELVHETRTPLTLMSLPLDAIENVVVPDKPDENKEETAATLSSADKGKVRQHIAAIRRNMNYLLGITNQLLDFQKEENGGIILVKRSTDMRQLLRQVYEQFADAAEVQKKQLQLQLPDEPVVLNIDRDKMMKVLMNLVANAMKYARSEVILRLTATESIDITIIDDGPGVPEQEREKVFDRYYQINHDNVSASLGTGIGLAYAKMLAEAHQGDMTCEDAPGGGSCFTLTLKAEASTASGQESAAPPEGLAEVSQTAIQAPAPADEAAGSPHTSYRILLVEDNEELLKTTADGLRQWYKVTKAHDGMEALDLLKYQEVDIIVSDVMMPRMDGVELCRRLKQQVDTSHLPVILLTAKVSVEAKVEGMEGGADIYLEKPFSIRQLHAQIENLLRLRQQFYERMRSLEGFRGKSPEPSDKPLGLNQQDMKFIETLQKSVEQNMRDDEFTIDILAEQLNMSRSSFYRKIKALTGMTPTDYLKTARMNQAAHLLRTGMRSSEVAERVGFTSSSYFAKCFRAQFGCLPKDYSTA